MSPRHVAVVGAGPAGLAAARTALAAGARVTLIDAAEQPGGQYHRMLPEAYAADRPERLQHGWSAFDRRRRQVLGHPRCVWLPETAVWALERPQSPGGPRVHVLCGPADGAGRHRRTLDPDALVLAPGAHDRVLPFPGWQLPGVFTAGAAQALAKGERVAVGDRVVVAGSGPFLLPVAASLLEAGSRVLEVLEANTSATAARGWSRRPWELAGQFGKAAELAAYTWTLARDRVPYRLGRTVVEARGVGRVEEVVTARLRPDWSVVPGSERTRAVDAVCVSHGFSPQLELPLAAGCALRVPGAATCSAEVACPEGEFVEVDGDQRTSVPGVYAAGEVTGVAGAPAARAEGAVAGWTAAGGDPAAHPLRALRRARDQGRAFAERLTRAHPIGAAWPGWLRPGTTVCRCEETTYGELCAAVTSEAGAAPRTAKLGTRAGLGPCQARVCGPTVAELSRRLGGAPCGRPAEGLPAASPHRRPVAQPIRLGELAASPIPFPPDLPGPPDPS
ncbi:FAD-dependent oxidoreductase [Streptomyces sp. NBC_01795]|uniref:FAD-dependent oxidoreductase n=1 Tax=unclassified Streptomyces TaxID=2593676 RepID=UPI002DDACFF0|nr:MULTISPECIES: FAD-dependent oxidoreductase [unclassified Streptomyces]WSA90750.1 FAD-dependent oxidoreductase [Streptomyces sp. NBC_01795]WSS16646.1 FAD-dependent oxidoreductase [Streptomyces sp. NBC_01186]